MPKLMSGKEVFFEGSASECDTFLAMVDAIEAQRTAEYLAWRAEIRVRVQRILGSTPEQMVAYLTENLPKLDEDGELADDDVCPVSLRSWLEKFPPTTPVEVLHKGDERYAGNRISTTHTSWLLAGHTFSLYTYPDWDNYRQDWSIDLDDRVVSKMEN